MTARAEASSPSRRREFLLTCSVKHRLLQVYSLQSGDSVGECTGHKNGVWCLANQGDELFFSGGRDKRVLEWKLDPEGRGAGKVKLIAEYAEHQDWIRDICSVSESLIASASDDTYVKVCLSFVTAYRCQVWDTNSKWCKATTPRVQADKTAVTKVICLGRDKPSLIYSSEGGYIHHYDIETGTVKASWQAHEATVTGLVNHPGRRNLLFSCSQYSDIIKVWDSRLPLRVSERPVSRLVSHTNEIWDLLIHRESLYTAGQDGTIKEWDMSFENTRTWRRAHEGYTVYTLASFKSDYLLSGGDDGSVRKWNLTNGSQAQQWDTEYPVHDLIAF